MCTVLSMAHGLFKPRCFAHVTGTCLKETALFFNVHLSYFVDFLLCPTNKYMFKVYNKKIRLICMCSSLKINTACHRSFVFNVDFDHSHHINIFFLLLTLNKCLSVECERQVIMFWKSYFKVYFTQHFVIAPNWNKVRPHKVLIMIWTYYGHMFHL